MYDINFRKISGRWNKKEYYIIRKLGGGGVGDVYLASCSNRGLMAIKMGRDMLSITKEYNWMKKYKGRNYVPAVYELDDFETKGCIYHFFTMEYIEGYDLGKALNKNISIKLRLQLFLIILKIIWDMNEEGLIYSDLKQENIMVDKKNNSIRLIDFGSVTKAGLGVKEYTPMYDRAYWGLGKRLADSSYQTFSAAILLISLLLGRKIHPQKDNLEDVINSLNKSRVPKEIILLIEKCIEGRIDNCGMFYNELIKIPYAKPEKYNKLNFILYFIMIVLFILLGALILIFITIFKQG